MNKTLTVIVPIDSFEHINSTIDSLLRQTYEDIEIITINDMVDIKATSILNNYKSKKLTCFLTAPNEDWDIVAKKILKKCKTSYVSLIHDGTILSPNWALQCINSLQNSKEADGIFANAVKLTDTGMLSVEPSELQTLPDVIFINNYNQTQIIDHPLITMVSNYDYLLPNSSRLPYAAKITDDILAGVRNKLAYKKIDFTSLNRFTRQLNHDNINSNCNKLKEISDNYCDEYLQLYIAFSKNLLLTGNLICFFQIFMLFINQPGNRKKIIKLIIGKK